MEARRFEELLDSVREAGAIVRGEVTPSRVVAVLAEQPGNVGPAILPGRGADAEA